MVARRRRSDSIAAQVDVARRAQQTIDFPSNIFLTKAQKVFFANVLVEFPRSEWTAHRLELAALLAREMDSMERNQRLFAEEGEIMTTDKGTPVVNPRRSVIQMNAGSILSMRRSLSLNARAQGKKAGEEAARRGAAIRIEEALSDDGEGFLN